MKKSKIPILLLFMLMLVIVPAKIHSAPQENERKLGTQLPRLLGTTVVKTLDSGEHEEQGVSSNSDSTKENIQDTADQNFPKSSESKPKKSLLSITGITEYEERGPITILNDTAFTLPTYDFPGNGTYDDPYLISGYNITDSSGILIHIENTSKSFKIENCYLNGNGSYFQSIFLSNVTDGTIANNIICNISVGSMFSAAIHLIASHNNTFLNNTIFDCDNGIFLSYSLENTIINNIIRNNKITGLNYAIFLNESSKATIVNNTIHDLTGSGTPAVGIMQFFSDNSLIHGNLIYNLFSNIVTNAIMAAGSCSNNNYTSNTIYNSDTYAIYIQDNSNNNIVFNNTLFDTSTAIALYANSRFNNIYNNRIYNVAQSAISFTESHNNSVSSNVINGSNYALDLFDSYNNTFRYNIISNSSYGLYIYSFSGAEDNIIEWNNFINNTIHAYDSGSNNVYSHNYWDDHTSPDADTDGLVDTPYYIDQPVPDSLIDSYPRAYPYMNHAPVYIDDNTDFETLGFPGDGTQGNPYMINNFYFMDSSSTLIHIENTAAHFRISNNVFNGLGSNFNCIRLVNVTYGTIEYNIICDIQSAIYLQESSSNTLSSNTIHDISFSAIDLDISHNTIIVSNNISDCAADAIWLIESDTNTITGNTINNCSYSFNEAIYLESSCDNNIISGNTISNCRYNGIYLYESCNNNTLSDNMIYNIQSGDGILLDNSSNNALLDNTIHDCSTGIRLTSSSHNTLTGNTIHDCSTGIYVLTDSNNNTLLSNTIHDIVGVLTGIHISSSHNNTLTSNKIYNITGPGIHLSSSDDNTLLGNTIYDCSEGIQLNTAHNNTLSDNFIYDIEGVTTGIVLRYSDFNILTNNTIANCTASSGIWLFDSHNNTLLYNMIHDCDPYGIYIYGSSNNTIWSNNIYNNSQHGLHITYFLGSSENNSVKWNNFLDNNAGMSQASDSGTNNVFSHNYWNDWTSPDTEPDGIVDDPYDIQPINGAPANQDLFPLTTPVGPRVIIVTPFAQDYGTNTIPVMLSGYARHYWYAIDDGPNQTWMVGAEETFTDGTYTLHVYGNDTLGNIGYASVRFTIDTTPPTVEIISPISTIYSHTNVPLTYTVTGEYITLTLYLNGYANTTAIPTGSVLSDFPDVPPILDGSYNITIVAVDLVGHVGKDTVLLTIDTTPPSISIDSPTATTYATGTITVVLSSDDDDAVHYWYYIADVDSNNQTWIPGTTRSLDDGEYTLYAFGNDSVGNIGYAKVEFIIDTTLPTTSATTPTTATQETTPESSTTTTTTTSEAASGSFPGVFAVVFFLVTSVVVIRRHKKK